MIYSIEYSRHDRRYHVLTADGVSVDNAMTIPDAEVKRLALVAKDGARNDHRHHRPLRPRRERCRRARRGRVAWEEDVPGDDGAGGRADGAAAVR